MNSNDTKQYVKGGDLAMLRRILDAAGPHEGEAHVEPETRDAAARRLLALFEQGISTESGLAATFRAGMQAPGLDGAAAPVTAAGGYRFGRRVERNGTWTIYHVFSGVPAEYASWKMVGLNVKTAERALKILNAPASAQPAS